MENELPEIEELENQRSIVTEKPASALPLILTMAALLIWFVFQTYQLIVERNSLSGLKANFESALQESQKMQSQLQALVSKTMELASQGNEAAKAVVDELEKKGIPLKAPSAPPAK